MYGATHSLELAVRPDFLFIHHGRTFYTSWAYLSPSYHGRARALRSRYLEVEISFKFLIAHRNFPVPGE